MTEFVALRAGMDSYRKIDKCLEDKHSKIQKSVQSLGFLLLMTREPDYLVLKQNTENASCLRLD